METEKHVKVLSIVKKRREGKRGRGKDMKFHIGYAEYIQRGYLILGILLIS